jgi:uroporphyrinogen-III synthase
LKETRDGTRRKLRVVVTRARAQSAGITDALEAGGLDVVRLPLIEIVDPPDPSLLERAVADARKGSFAWVIFTSVNAADRTLRVAPDLGAVFRKKKTRVAAVGTTTAERLRELEVAVDLTPAPEATAFAFSERTKDPQTSPTLSPLQAGRWTTSRRTGPCRRHLSRAPLMRLRVGTSTQ